MLFDGVLYLKRTSQALEMVLGYILVDYPSMLPFSNPFQRWGEHCGSAVLMIHMEDMSGPASLISSACLYITGKLVAL